MNPDTFITVALLCVAVLGTGLVALILSRFAGSPRA
jgi:hypothetical protein